MDRSMRVASLLLVAGIQLAAAIHPYTYRAFAFPITQAMTAEPHSQSPVSEIQLLQVSQPALLILQDFVQSVVNGEPAAVVGVYAPSVLAMAVVQQPAHDPTYVDSKADRLTQFGYAARYGTVGLLAHYDLAGGLFYDLAPGQRVALVYGDGNVRDYVISNVRHFQALSPTDPFSNFVDLDQLDKSTTASTTPLTSTQLFYQIYAGGNVLVFQTCIPFAGESSWGRLFVIAIPIE